ncbi:MAG: flagellin [Candidatus Rokubacteria bacterium]|nr:flagellin [Candidatus Rokubacteria bacterium]
MASGDLSRIRTNISALNALQALNQINSKLVAVNQRLSTGKRINSAGDDPAGLTLSSSLDVRARLVAAASNNVGDAQNVLNIAEGGLNSLNDLMSQLGEKILKAASDTQGVSEKSAIQTEIDQLSEEIDSIASTTQFNGVVLLTTGGLTFQSGPDGFNVTRFALTHNFTSAALGIGALTVATQALASASLGSVAAAITSVKAALQLAGAAIERLRVKDDGLGITQINLRAANSRIMDADLAAEQLEASKLQILQQTATAELAAANTSPESILSLFRR